MMRIFPPYSFSCAIQSSFPQFFEYFFQVDVLLLVGMIFFVSAS